MKGSFFSLHGLCAPRILYVLQLGSFFLFVFKDTQGRRTFCSDKIDHNVNTMAAEGGIVKIARVIAWRPWV